MRESIDKTIQYEIFCRDNWHCRYCNDAVIFTPLLKILDNISPNRGYYHPNGKSDKMLSLFANKFASVDHIVPVTKGGKNEVDNFVTSCWECNLKFGNKTHKEGKPKPQNKNSNVTNWDGFSSLYPKLINKSDSWCKIIDSQ